MCPRDETRTSDPSVADVASTRLRFCIPLYAVGNAALRIVGGQQAATFTTVDVSIRPGVLRALRKFHGLGTGVVVADQASFEPVHRQRRQMH